MEEEKQKILRVILGIEITNDRKSTLQLAITQAHRIMGLDKGDMASYYSFTQRKSKDETDVEKIADTFLLSSQDEEMDILTALSLYLIVLDQLGHIFGEQEEKISNRIAKALEKSEICTLSQSEMQAIADLRNSINHNFGLANYNPKTGVGTTKYIICFEDSGNRKPIEEAQEKWDGNWNDKRERTSTKVYPFSLINLVEHVLMAFTNMLMKGTLKTPLGVEELKTRFTVLAANNKNLAYNSSRPSTSIQKGENQVGNEYDEIKRMGYNYGQLGNDNCYFALRKGNKWTLRSDDLKEIHIDYVECDGFKEIGWTPKGFYAILMKDDKYKLCIGMKERFPLILPNEYDYISMRYCMANDGVRVEGLCFLLRKGNKWAVCSNDLRQLSTFRFDDVGNMINSKEVYVTIEVDKQKVQFLYNTEGSEAWNVKEIRFFARDEIAAISRAEVVASDYGKSVCFFMKFGGQTYIPLSVHSKLGVGDSFDLSTGKILTLCRKGSNDMTRVEE